MIISHRYGFIFIKTGKVGGTSLEMALSRCLGPEDIITPVSRTDERERFRLGYRTSQNFQKGIGELSPRDLPRWVKGQWGTHFRQGEDRLKGRSGLPKRYWDHMGAAEIRERVGADIWDRYFKFTVERNPWDKVVSAYFWDPKKRKTGLSFQDFIRSGKPLRSNFDRYTINGILATDRIFCYDQLYPGLTQLSKRLGLPEDVGQIMRSLSAKGGYRPNREVEGFFDQETREIVEIFFAREIRLLGFRFGEEHQAEEAGDEPGSAS